jgi:hypothetical protein
MPIAAWTADSVLAQARTLAGELDPDRAGLYHRMPSSRWVQALDLGAELLTAHAAYRLHHTRGRGRRQHAAEIHVVLDTTNASNLVAVVALLLVLGRILDGSTRET